MEIVATAAQFSVENELNLIGIEIVFYGLAFIGLGAVALVLIAD